MAGQHVRPQHALFLGPMLLIAACLNLLPFALSAEQAPPVPDPARLSPDWWSYFDVDEGLKERIEAFSQVLDALDTEVEASENVSDADELLALNTEIDSLLVRYVESKQRTLPPAVSPNPVAESYSLVAILDLGTRVREAQLEFELERDQSERQNEMLVAVDSQLSDQKVSYLGMSEDQPGRLRKGLQLVRDRLNWAVGEENLRLLKARTSARRSRAENLAQELDSAGTRLKGGEDEVRRFRSLADRAASDAERLRAEATSERLRTSETGESDVDRAKARRQAQKLLHYQVRIAEAELVAADYELAATLAAFLGNPSADMADVLRERRSAVNALSLRYAGQLGIWRKATDHERSAATKQLALLAGSDAVLADIHRSRIARADDTARLLSGVSEQQAEGALLYKLAGQLIVEEQGRLADYLASAREALVGTWSTIKGLARTSLFEINQTPVTMLGVLRVLLILLAAWWISKLARRGLEEIMHRREAMSRSSLYTLGRLTHYVVLAIGFFVALSSIGIDFTKFAIIISALSVGLGFGLQAIFSNFVAGLIILFEKSLKVGDFVELESGVHGEVREINIRGTLITTNDNIDILVPNSEFVNGRVINWTLRDAFRRLRVPFNVAYGSDKDLVREAVLEAADAVPYTLKGMPGRQVQVWLVGLGDSSLDFELVVWLTPEAVVRPGRVKAAYTWAIESALREYDIEIPFPQRDLHVRLVFGQQDDAGLELMTKSASTTRTQPG